MLLNDDQKATFARWLEIQISTSEGMCRQFESLKVPAALITKERNEQFACKIVLRIITSGESMSVGAADPR